MDGFDTITMSWATPMPMQTVTGPEGHMQMPMVSMDPYDQRSTFDAETFAGQAPPRRACRVRVC
jgi:hypothetical protein